jgi:hypothetical protein
MCSLRGGKQSLQQGFHMFLFYEGNRAGKKARMDLFSGTMKLVEHDPAINVRSY